MSLPVPKILEKTEAAIENGGGFVNGVLGVKPLEFHDVEIGNHLVKYTFRGNDAVFQFYRKDGGLYPQSFRSRIFRAFSNWPVKYESLDIEWIPELQSWSVIVRGGGVTPPGSDDIDSILKTVVS